MTKQLTPQQVKELRVYLKQFGVKISVERPKEWQPKTEGGKRAKRLFKYWADHPMQGVKTYEVRGQDGKWYSEGDGALFDAAKIWQFHQWQRPELYRDCLPVVK